MPQIDHSRLLLDASAVAPYLAEAIPAWRDAGPARLRVHQSRRRISRKTEEQGAPYLGVAYEWIGEGATPWCYLRAYSRGLSAGEAARTGGIHLPALDAVAYLLPNDPTLAALPRFLDRAGVDEALPREYSAPTAPRIVRYEPESHCTARFVLGDATGRLRAVYGKCYGDERWRAQARHLLALWPNGEIHVDAFAVARPLGAYAGFGAVWTEARDGIALRRELLGRDAARWTARAVRGLQHLQAMPPLADTRLDAPALLARTDKQARKLLRADPSLRASIEPLLDRLARTQPEPTGLVNVHGDFHVDQMVCSGDRVVLFDFDNLALGHPAHDIADFVSQLVTDATLAAPQRMALARGFIAGAGDAFGRGIERVDLDWHLRLLLVRKAYSFFVRHGVDWRQRAEQALGLAARGFEAFDLESEHAASALGVAA